MKCREYRRRSKYFVLEGEIGLIRLGRHIDRSYALEKYVLARHVYRIKSL